MLSPILNLANKVSATLQSPNLDLHAAVGAGDGCTRKAGHECACV